MWIIGNWKMHKTSGEASAYMDELCECLKSDGVKLTPTCRLGIAVPFTAISSCVQHALSIEIGAQNMHDAVEGAFTGEIGSEMLEHAGAHFVILGHSERRHNFGESDTFIARKVIRALTASKLSVVFCIGETLEQRQEGQTQEVITTQIQAVLQSLPSSCASRLGIAYEPVWAIGAGKVASASDIEQVLGYVRECLDSWDRSASSSVAILYGGSVTPSNVDSLLKIDQLSGVLVGGASLQPHMLSTIAKVCFT